MLTDPIDPWRELIGSSWQRWCGLRIACSVWLWAGNILFLSLYCLSSMEAQSS